LPPRPPSRCRARRRRTVEHFALDTGTKARRGDSEALLIEPGSEFGHGSHKLHTAVQVTADHIWSTGASATAGDGWIAPPHPAMIASASAHNQPNVGPKAFDTLFGNR